MNCAYCEDRLSDYLENSLPANERLVLDTHLASCEACTTLLAGIQTVMEWGHSFPVHSAPEWLPVRIVANTPRVVRVTWRDWLAAAWRTVSEPRFAMAIFTATLVLGWVGNATAIGSSVGPYVRHPSGIYHGVEGWANRTYADIVRNYYSSPLVMEIQCQIHRIGQLRENS